MRCRGRLRLRVLFLAPTHLELGLLCVVQLEGGGSLLWSTVAQCVPGRLLELVGHLSPDYGGPATSMLKLELEPAGETTLLKLRDALVGHLSPTVSKTMRDGWMQLFTDGLAAHAAKA